VRPITIRSCFNAFFALTIAFGVIGFPKPLQAASYHARVEADGGTLFVNGEGALTVLARAPQTRARSAARTLELSAAREVVLQKISRRKWAIATPDGGLVLLVTRADSRQSGGTVEGLAREWASQIDRLLSLPPITVSLKAQPAVIPHGSTKSYFIGGAALPDQISVADAASGVTQTRFNRTSRTISITGLRTGFAELTLKATDEDGGSSEVKLNVLIEDWAGTIDSSADASVTGGPASVDTIAQAVRTSVYRGVALHPDAYLEVIRQPKVYSELPTGTHMTVPVTIRAVGSDMIPVEQVVSVHVDNSAAVPPETAQALFYSNNPETVKHPQTLFNAFVSTLNKPVRLVFHHQDCSSVPMTMRVEIINTGQSTATVHIVRGLSGAGPDPVAAGARAGTEFFKEWQTDSGELTSIPPQTRLEIFILKTDPSDVASGIVEVSQLSGLNHSLLLHVAAEPIDTFYTDGLDSLVKTGNPNVAAMALLPVDPANGQNFASTTSSDQIYTTPSLQVAGFYTVGGPWMHLNIGTDNPLARLTGTGSALAGNYGVIYEMNITLSNPTTIRRQVSIAFESGAGDVSGVFSVAGGHATTISDLQPPNEQELTRITLAPGSTQSIDMQTVPLSGSAYPAAIIAHAI
jgi:hypothetical protein